jgi:RNA polymerase primary sigma factor
MKTNNELNINLINQNNLDELIRVNTKYIRAIAKTYKQDEEILDDLIQEGRLALIEAVSNFDSTINPNFLNIATYYIKKYMIEFIIKNGNTIYLPHNFHRTKKKIDKKIANDELYDIYSDDELTRVEKLAQTNAKRVISGDLSNDEGNATVFTTIAYNEGDYKERTEQEYQARHIVFSLIEKLTKDSDKQLIRMRFGIDQDELSVQEIADKLGYSRQHINDKLNKIIKKLSTF